MRRTVRGVQQLAQALLDFRSDKPIRAVDESGRVKTLSDGSGEQTVSDVYLRDEFPPRGKVRAKRAGDTPTEILKSKLAEMSDSLEQLENSYSAVCAVQSDDGRGLAETDGVDPQLCADWRNILSKIDDDLNVWGRKFRQKYAANGPQIRPDGDIPGNLDQVATKDAVAAEETYGEWADDENAAETSTTPADAT
jgi:hypothetical protein